MTQKQSNFIKENWYKWINLSTFVIIITYIVYESKRQERVDLHMDDYKTFKIKTELEFKDYVPRTEVEKTFKNIEDLLIESKADNKINNRLLIEILKEKK